MKTKLDLILEAYQPCNPVDAPSGFNDEEFTGGGQPPRKQGCQTCKKGSKFYYRCPGSNTPPENEKYEGTYVKKGFGILPDFKVNFKRYGQQLRMSMGGVRYILSKSNDDPNMFWSQTYGITVDFYLEEDPKEIVLNLSTPTSGVLTTLEGANVLRLMASPPIGQGAENILKKSEEAEESTEQDGPIWDCLKAAIDKMQGIRLGSSLKGDYKYVPVDSKWNGEETDYYFYKDYKVEWKTSDTMEVIKTGTWECIENNKGFKITWEDGVIQKFPKRISLDGDDEDTDASGEDEQPPRPTITPCRSYVAETKIQNVINGRGVLKKCMKGPTIEKIQNMPVFQSYLFDVLRSNGQDEIVDDMFGPYMEKAVKIYQSTNGVYTLNTAKSGIIDSKTYKLLVKQDENRPGPGPKPPEPPTPTPTPSPVPPKQEFKPQFSNQKTKF